MQFAEEDWQDAHELAGRGTGRNTAWLLHQSAEKYLKAVIIAGGRIPPTSHDLVLLLGEVDPGLVSSGNEAAAAELLTYVVPRGRYPGDLPVPNREEAKALERAAGTLRALARRRLGLG